MTRRVLAIMIAVLALAAWVLIPAMGAKPIGTVDLRAEKRAHDVVLTWTYDGPPTKFRVYRGPLSAPFDTWTEIGRTKRPWFVDAGAASSGDDYAYRVCAGRGRP